MLKQIACAMILSVFVFTLPGCHNSNEHSIVNYDLNLDDLSSPIDLSPSASNLKLTRGTYTYTLTKKTPLNNEKYVVYSTDNITYTSEHKASPDDAYCRYLEIIPADDKAAVRAMDTFKEGRTEIKTEADMAKAQQMISDTQRLDQVKFVIGILPANDSIEDISKQIKQRDVINVSGIHFKHSDIVNDGRKELLTHCLANCDVFYLKKLQIE